ncbi:diguanylate cyclase, partial [uncultured Marinobacter sp.]|uniref:GGDEF domain-containing protein n=1 Tax=uncultured Marinobacter sp. TaxID=187379 RepID=UPI0030DDC7BF
MTSSRSSIPDKWKPAFERYQEQIESHLVHGGAWLMLVTVSLYHVSHTYFHVHEADLGQNELLLRLPLLAATVLALSSHWLGLPRWPARYFLRLMGLGLSGMALSLLFLFARYEPLMVSQVSDAMTIALFGATVLSLRNFKEWLLIVLLPILLFCIAAVVADLPLLTLLGVFIGPALIMLVTNILMALARIVDAEGFIARERLREMATTDPLTGLLNRRAFMPLVQQEQARAQRSGTPFSVILADLDKFKRVNDTWGHETGDQVLQKTAELLQS